MALFQFSDGEDRDVFYAAKTIEKPRCPTRTLRQEARVLRHVASLRNPFVPVLYYSFRTVNALHLIMEFIPGANLKQATKTQPFTPPQVKRIMAELVTGVHLLHREGIIVCDLKPDNIMMSHTGHVKIVDFGIANVLGSHSRAVGVAGTFGYTAPDVYSRDGYTERVDWFSVGAVFFYLQTRGDRMINDQGTYGGIRIDDVIDRHEFGTFDEVRQMIETNAQYIIDHSSGSLFTSRFRRCRCRLCQGFRSDASATRLLHGLILPQARARWTWQTAQRDVSIPACDYFRRIDFRALAAGHLGEPIVDRYRLVPDGPLIFADDGGGRQRIDESDAARFRDERPTHLEDLFESYSFENELKPSAPQQARECSGIELWKNCSN